MRRAWWCRERRGSRGSVTPFVLISILALIPLAGLVIDGGRQLNGRARAVAYAQEAARAGAQALDLDLEETRLLPEVSRQIVEQYCNEAINGDGAAVRGDPTLVECEPMQAPAEDAGGEFLTIGVRTVVEVDPLLLDMFGAGPLRAQGEAVAQALSGVAEADSGAISTVPPPSVSTQEPDDAGLPTIPPGSQGPLDPGSLAPCATPTTPTPTPTPTGGGGGGGGGGGDEDPGGGEDPGEDEDPEPPEEPDDPTPPPPNNDLDDDVAPTCPTTGPGGDGR